MELVEFRRIVYEEYQAHGRSFPWREDTEPWGVLVSEFMLQQTQTERVIPYWLRWKTLWPRPEDLATANFDLIIREWSGLGYNRRARFLKLTAERIVEDYAGLVPQNVEDLKKLPGIGDYTAKAVACFAFGQAVTLIETNIRSAVIHCFFPGERAVKDSQILQILDAALDRVNPRHWHWALMDYGAVLKKITGNPSRRSAHYTRQSKFEGSLRQARGKILKALVEEGPLDAEQLAHHCVLQGDRLYPALKALTKDGMVAERDGVYRIS